MLIDADVRLIPVLFVRAHWISPPFREQSTPILHEYYVGCGGKKQRGGKKIAAASSKGGKKFGEGNGTVGKKQNVRRARRRTQVDPLVNQDLCPDDFDLSFSLSMSLPVVPPTGPIESEPGAGSASGSNSDSGDDTGGDFSLDDDDAITPPTDDSNVGGTIIPDLPWLDFADDDFTVPSNDDESPSNDPF